MLTAALLALTLAADVSDADRLPTGAKRAIESADAAVAKAQQAYLEAVLREQEKLAKVLQREMEAQTKAGALDAALAVKAEFERVRSGELLRAARAIPETDLLGERKAAPAPKIGDAVAIAMASGKGVLFVHGDEVQVGEPADPAAARVRLVQGLSDPGCVSFQLVATPTRYLRHHSMRLRCHARDASPLFAADATFRLKDDGRTVSFESVNFPGHLLQLSGTAIVVAKPTTPEAAAFLVRRVAE